MMKNDNIKKVSHKFIEDIVLSVPKKKKTVCGDYTLCERNTEYTTFIICDGIGSGLKANIAAIMCAFRLKELIQSGMSLYEVCKSVVKTMHKARTEDIPFAAFSVVRIMSEGQYTVITYEMPAPVLIQGNTAYYNAQRYFTMEHEVVGESTGVLHNGDSLMVVSDGVSQAGLGTKFSLGWTMDGFTAFVNRKLINGAKIDDIPKVAIKEVYNMCGFRNEDDVTVALLKCRKANVINILSGPPILRTEDNLFVSEFMEKDGLKIVCGSTTSDMVAKNIGKTVKNKTFTGSFSKPPSYEIEGIALVTEGAVTLNQLYNIIEEDPESFNDDNCVIDLCQLILWADIVRFYVGGATNPGHKSITFKQIGIIPRTTIIDLISEKLKNMGKLVVKYEC